MLGARFQEKPQLQDRRRLLQPNEAEWLVAVDGRAWALDHLIKI